MPKFTLLLGRRTMQTYDLPQAQVTVGREEGVDIVIDNASVSRKHAVIREEGGNWVVEDMGSSNGTFLNGDRIEGATPLKEGDEIGLGKFGLVFGKEIGEAKGGSAPAAPVTTHGGTTQIKTHELEEMLAKSSSERKAHLDYESGGRKGRHAFNEAPAVVFGTDELCDIRVPKGPKHDLLFIRSGENVEARNLGGMFSKMTVNGSAQKRVKLKNGDVIEMSGLKVVFQDDVG